MQSTQLLSERILLQNEIQFKNEKFDKAIELEDDFELAKKLYREIKELKSRLKHIMLINEL